MRRKDKMQRSFLGMAAGALVLAAPALATATGTGWPTLPERAPAPAGNPTTPAKVELGRMLYFDPRLSSTGTVSCNSCHNVMAGGEDARPTSVGVKGQVGGRNAPTVWNAAFHPVQFWDGRAASLEEQAVGPVTNPIEMGMPSLEALVERLKALGYEPMFREAFGGDDPVTPENFAKAVASFERTLITPGSAYDRWASGDRGAMTAQQVRGLRRFRELGCAGCHTGPHFGASESAPFQKFPVFANSPYVKRYGLDKDLGRYEVTKKEADKHLFRVPTLRNVAVTAPYFHNGAVATLEEAVRVMGSAQLGRELSDRDVADIVAFLEALTGPFPRIEAPRLPVPSGRAVRFER